MVGLLVVGSFVIATLVTICLLARRSRRRDADQILHSSAASIDLAMTAKVMPPKPEPAVEAELDLSAPETGEPVIVLLDPAATATQPIQEVEQEGGVDRVLQALIDRVRTSRTRLVRRDIRIPRKDDELTLSGDDVPRRPGQLSAFAELSDAEKRRVIIRVLCLLVAQTEDRDRETEVLVLPAESPTKPATARDLWPDAAERVNEARLPTRRRLVPVQR